MSTSIKAFLTLTVLFFAAGCQQEEEAVMVEPAPIVAEPTYNKM